MIKKGCVVGFDKTISFLRIRGCSRKNMIYTLTTEFPSRGMPITPPPHRKSILTGKNFLFEPPRTGLNL